MAEPNNLDASSLSVEDRQDMGLLGTPVEPAVNAAGRPYDPSTGRLLPADAVPVEQPHDPDAQATVTSRAKHSKDLYDAAAYFSLSQEDADAIPTPQLRKMLREMTATQQREQDAQARARFWEEQRVQKLPTERQQQPEEAEDQFDLDGELDPTVNPKTHRVLKKMWEENQRLRKQVAEVDSTIKAQATTAFTQKVDRAIAKLAADDYGTGEFGDFLPGSDEHAARMKVYAEAGLTGKETSQAQIDKAIKKAHLYLQADKPARAVGYEVTEPAPVRPAKPANGRITPEQWNGAGVGAPTRRAAEALPDGEAKAIAGVAAKMGKSVTQYDEDAEIKKTLLRRGPPAA